MKYEEIPEDFNWGEAGILKPLMIELNHLLPHRILRWKSEDDKSLNSPDDGWIYVPSKWFPKMPHSLYGTIKWEDAILCMKVDSESIFNNIFNNIDLQTIISEEVSIQSTSLAQKCISEYFKDISIFKFIKHKLKNSFKMKGTNSE